LAQKVKLGGGVQVMQGGLSSRSQMAGLLRMV
jgi:hypothetical protein